jgi:large subunit ribosomal protein L10
MNRQEKQVVIDTLRNDFLRSRASFLVEVQGLTVSHIQDVRKRLRTEGGTLKLAKNTLLKIATHDIPGVQGLQPYFKKQVAIVFASNESSPIARIIYDTAQKNERFLVIAGCVDARVIDRDMIKFLSSLPSRPVLAAQMCGVLKSPIIRHVSVLNQVITKLLYVLDQASKK